MRPGLSPLSVRYVSTTRSGTWLGSITPPDPTRIVFVRAATVAINTSGDDDAIDGIP
jgi:hypothetical protein